MNKQTNFPSLARLMDVFETKENALKALRIMKCGRDELLSSSQAAAKYSDGCFNPPALYSLRLVALSELGSLYGVECARRLYKQREPGLPEYAEYLNTGDTYAPTVIYWRERFRVQSMGDFIERQENNQIYFH